jgi:hypothetical protein
MGDETHCPLSALRFPVISRSDDRLRAAIDSDSAAKSGDDVARNYLLSPHVLNDFPHAHLH